MTDQQKAFCDEYVKHFNATKAAISVGYSEKSARSQASQILALDEVALYIEDKLADSDAGFSHKCIGNIYKQSSHRLFHAVKPIDY